MYYLDSFCFVCLSEKTLLSAICHEEIHYQVQYALPELTIFYPKNPVYICSSCHTILRSYSMFKKKCLDNYSRLNNYIKILQGSNSTPDQTSSELQIRFINYEKLIKHENNIQLNVKEENEEVLKSWKGKHNQKTEVDDNIDVKEESFAAEETAQPDFYQQQQVEKIESLLDDIKDDGSNVLSEDNNAIDNEQKIEVVDDIDVKEESLVENARPDLYQQVVKSDSVLHNIQDGGSNVLSENTNAIDNEQKTEVDDDIDVKEESLTSEQSAHPNLYHIFNKHESVSDDEQNASRESENNNEVDKYETNSNSNTDSQEFQCLMCKEVFTDRLTFDTHLRNHIKNIRGLKCVICNNKFGRKQILVDHMKYHFGFKDYECSICKKKFVQNSQLKTHTKMHEGIKNYECTICKKKFLLNYTLKKHIKTHEGEKNYECSICKKKFANSYYLKVHMKIHMKRDFECSICKKQFTLNIYLTRHMKTHGNKGYECSICKKIFLRNSHLKIHSYTHDDNIRFFMDNS